MGLKWEYLEEDGHKLEVQNRHWDASCQVLFHHGERAEEPMEPSIFIQNRTLIYFPDMLYGKVHGEEARAEVLAQQLKQVIVEMAQKQPMVATITLPKRVPVNLLVQALHRVAHSKVWENTSLLNLRWLCPSPELFSAVDKYFQGPWDL